jgi:hypothetical protein
MGSNRQENDGFFRMVIAKTVFTSRYSPAFFADDEYQPKITIDSGAPTPNQIQLPARIRQGFGIGVGIFQKPFDPFPDSRL